MGRCGHLLRKQIGFYDTGFAESYDNPVAKVYDLRENSRAYLAGLRNGQNILEKKIEWWKPWKKVELTIQDSKGQRWIKYLPQSQKTIDLPVYQIDSKKHEFKCSSWFGI